MNLSFDVVVIGGGIVGLSAAIAMSQRGFSVALMDAGPLTMDVNKTDARVYAINQASQLLLQALKVWDQLDHTRLSPYEHMHVWDAAQGAPLHFDARMYGCDRLGTIIEESVIKQALLQEASAQAITLYPGARISAVVPASDGVTLSDATRTWHAHLLIVADGASSAIRPLLGVSLTSWSYHQHAIVTTIQTEQRHQKTAYQVFHSEGPLAFLPLADPHQCSIVWSTTPARATALMALTDEAFSLSLSKTFEETLGACRVIGPRHVFPLSMRHVTTYSGIRWLLMGDAAHTIHPLAGLGLNVGLADLTAWLLLLDKDPGRTYAQKTLGLYQRQRKHAVWQMIALMEGLKWIFANPLPPVVMFRGFGLRLLEHCLPLKRFFIEQAAR